MISASTIFRLRFSFIILIMLLRLSIAQELSYPHKSLFAKYNFKQHHLKQDTLFEKYDVTNYDINIKIKPHERIIEGKVAIKFVVLENNLKDLKLDFGNLNVDSILFDYNLANFTHQNEILSIELNNVLPVGSMDSVMIYYQGAPIRGLYFRQNSYGDTVVYSQNEPFDAHYWFPCKDIPSDKALLHMSVIMPNTYKILSNGKLQSIQSFGTNTVQYNWFESYPIATYLISIAAGPYDIVSEVFTWQNYSVPVEYYLYPPDRERGETAIQNTLEMMEFFSNYIDTYPFISEKYAMSEVPFREAAAMENQTATTMGDFVLDNESVIAHELAHQWWGDALSPETFTDIWLNEGFATYFDALFTEYKYGATAFIERMTASKTNALGDGSINYALYDPPERYLFGGAVYHKGAWVLHMLRNKVGDANFKMIIKNYYNNFKYSNVTTNDFQNICESVSGLSLQTFFNQWIYISGLPRIFASWSKTDGNINIVLEQLQSEIIYDLDLQIQLTGFNKDTLFSVHFKSQKYEFNVPFSDQILSLVVDPNNRIFQTNNSPVYLYPKNAELLQVFPNPFNSELNIFYSVNRTQQIDIEIWDVLGQKVGTIQSERKKIGTHKIVWEVTNLASGSYYCLLRSEDGVDRKKIVLVK